MSINRFFNGSGPLRVRIPLTLRIKKTSDCLFVCLFYGVPQGIRTPDLSVRSRTLYPAELVARILFANVIGLLDILYQVSKRMQVFFSNFLIFLLTNFSPCTKHFNMLQCSGEYLTSFRRNSCHINSQQVILPHCLPL